MRKPLDFNPLLKGPNAPPPMAVSRPTVHEFVAGLPLGWIAAGLLAYGVRRGRGRRT